MADTPQNTPFSGNVPSDANQPFSQQNGQFQQQQYTQPQGQYQQQPNQTTAADCERISQLPIHADE